jgi:hypothetical protein
VSRVTSSVSIWILSALIIIGGTLWWSAASRSIRHLEAGKTWEAQGDLRRALRHYQWAARAYAPRSTTGPQALEQMWSLAQRVESDQPQLALEAYDLMRGSIWSTRWLSAPYETWATQVDERIIALRHDPFNRERFAATLSVDPRPSTGQSALLLLFALGAILSFIWLIRVGVSSELQITPRASRPASVLLVMTLGFFISLAL